MGALDLALVAAQALGDVRETTVFALCHDHGIALKPRFGCGIPAVINKVLAFDPRASIRELCRSLMLAFCRWLLPSGNDQDVQNLAGLLNARVCQADIPAV